MNKLRIAIIGTGGIANAHINAYLQMEDVEIVGGSDIIPGKARAFFDRYNLPDARDFEDTEEMLRTLKPDAVSVCTYNSTHAGGRPGNPPGGKGNRQDRHHRLPAPL